MGFHLLVVASIERTFDFQFSELLVTNFDFEIDSDLVTVQEIHYSSNVNCSEAREFTMHRE